MSFEPDRFERFTRETMMREMSEGELTKLINAMRAFPFDDLKRLFDVMGTDPKTGLEAAVMTRYPALFSQIKRGRLASFLFLSKRKARQLDAMAAQLQAGMAALQSPVFEKYNRIVNAALASSMGELLATSAETQDVVAFGGRWRERVLRE